METNLLVHVPSPVYFVEVHDDLHGSLHEITITSRLLRGLNSLLHDNFTISAAFFPPPFVLSSNVCWLEAFFFSLKQLRTVDTEYTASNPTLRQWNRRTRREDASLHPGEARGTRDIMDRRFSNCST